MSPAACERICRHCNELFLPDWRKRFRRQFSQKPQCRKASPARSHQLWLAQNPDHFRGSAHVERVQRWRQAHPGYARRSGAKRSAPPLPEILPLKPVEAQPLTSQPSPKPAQPLPDACQPLQDFILSKPLIIGLLAQQLDCTLQEDIEQTMRRLAIKGLNILGTTPGTQMNLKLPWRG